MKFLSFKSIVRNLTILLILVNYIHSADAQNRPLIQRLYNIADWGEASNFENYTTFHGMRVIDSGYVLLGRHGNLDTPSYTFHSSLYLARLDLKGDTVWHKRVYSPYHDSNMLYVEDILYGGLSPLLIDLGDGHFSFISHAVYYADTNKILKCKPVLNEFDLNGNLILQKVICDSNAFHSIATNAYDYSISDSTYIIELLQSPNQHNSMKYLVGSIVKIKRNGDKVWNSIVYEFDRNLNINKSSPKYLELKSDGQGGAIASGFGDLPQYVIPGVIENHNLFTRVDAQGNVLWQKSYRPNDYLVMLKYRPSVAFLPNGNHWFSVDATTLPPYPPGHDLAGLQRNFVLYYGECAPNGDTLWTSTFAHPNDEEEMDYKMSTNSGSLYYVDGAMYAVVQVYRLGMLVHALVKFDLQGHVKWYREYLYNPNIDGGFISNIQKSKEGYLAVAANCATGIYDRPLGAWLLVLDSTGCLTPGCDSVDTMWNAKVGINEVTMQQIEIEIFPNPTQGDLYINGMRDMHIIQIFTIDGKLVYQTAADSGKLYIDLHHYNTGTYMVNIKKGSKTQTFTVVKTD